MLPPALIAAIPVGASTICFFLVTSQTYFRKVDLPDDPKFSLKDPCRKEIRGGIEAVDYLTFVIFNDWFKLKNISYQQYLLASEWFTHIL